MRESTGRRCDAEPTGRRADAEPTGRRADVLRLLRAAKTPLRITEIAEQLQLHPNTVRFHLDTLLKAGTVELAQMQARVAGRPPQHFRAAPGMDRDGPRHYRVLAEVLINSIANSPNASKRAVEAGQAWGQLQASEQSEQGARPITKLVDLLDDMGFAPTQRRRSGQQQIALHRCPFLELAEGESQIVCAVHLGIMQGAMQQWGSSATIERLEPFAQPDLCLAHLAPTGGSQ